MAPRLFDRPILCAVLDGRALAQSGQAFALDLYLAGVDWIQLRDRSLSSLALSDLASSLVAARDEARDRLRSDPASAGGKPRVLVNRRVDLALSSGADGTHLGFDGLDEASVRRLLAEDDVVGRSYHCVQEIESQAAQTGAKLDYAHLAPIWNPFSKKPTRPAAGLDQLKKACGLGLPILAQGGVDATRAREAVVAGAAGVAVTGIITAARNPMAVARQLRQGLDSAIEA